MNKSKEQLISETRQLIALPDVYLKVRELLDDPASSIDDFAQAVSFDAGLVANILRIANSAFFGFATEIDNIKRAISIMGTAQLHDLVLATSTINSFSDIPDHVEDINSFWKRSIYTGVIAQLIGSKCNSLDSERYFVIGLLNNLGHLLLCLQLPDAVCEAVGKSRSEHKPISLIEKEMLGFDYAELGSALLKDWGLPDVFVESIHHHLDPASAPTFPLESAAINIANNISLQMGSNDNEQISNIPESAWQLTGLTQDDVKFLQAEGDQHYNEAVNLLM